MTLTRDQIFAKRMELPRETIDVPELGGTVLIRTLTLKEVREIHRLQKANEKDPLSLHPNIVAMACIDEAGNPLFVGEDVKLLNELPWAATDRIAKAVMKFNKLAGDDEETENGVPKA